MRVTKRIIAAALCAVVLAGTGAFAQRSGRGTATSTATVFTLQVIPNPAFATVTVNNAPAAGNIWSLPAGTYTVAASAQGYAPVSFSVTLTKNTNVPVNLSPAMAQPQPQPQPQPPQPQPQPGPVQPPSGQNMVSIDDLIKQLEALKAPASVTDKPGTPMKETEKPGTAKTSGPEKSFNEEGAPVTYIRKTAMYEASATFDKSVLLNPGTDVIYPGSVIFGESLDDGTYREYTKGTKRPIKISYDLTGSSGSVSETVMPTLSNFRDVHNRVLGKISGGASTSFTFEEIAVSEEADFSVKFNAGVTYSSPVVEASVKGGFSFGKGDKKNKYLVKFMQTFYTVDVDQGRDTFLFENFNVKDFKGYRPVYVSSVAYGRLAYLSVESTETWQNIKTTLEAAAEAKLANVKFNTDLETDYNKIKKNTTINITVIGGSKVATGIDSFMTMLTEDSFSRDNPGKIVSYKLRFVDDNSIANIKFAGSYPLTSTDVMIGKGFDVKVALEKFVAKVSDSGGEAEFYGDLRVYLAEDGQEQDKNALWSYSESRPYEVKKNSSNDRGDSVSFNLPTLRTATVKIKGRGLREDDNSGDDVFKDVNLDLPMRDMGGQSKTYILKSDYQKGGGEYMEFHVRVTATPVY